MEEEMEQYEDLQIADIQPPPAQPCTSDDGQTQNAEELLPCSIRCAGMTGEIPTLQCKRCLCLYHPECLGLPPNLNFKNFLCSNCEGGGPDERMPAQNHTVRSKTNDAKKTITEPRKMGEMKKPPPPLIRANFPKLPHKFMTDVKGRLPLPPRLPMLQPPLPFGRGGVRLKNRLEVPKLTAPTLSMLRPMGDSMSISPISMKRGRGRPPKHPKLLPQLSHRNLTITPISIPRKVNPPPVPNLHPMGHLGSLLVPTSQSIQHNRSIQSNNPNRLKPGLKVAVPKPKPINFNQSNLQQRMVQHLQNHQLQLHQKELKERNSSITSHQTSSNNRQQSTMFRRYAQSVVTIGPKKFVVVPRKSQESGVVIDNDANAESKPEKKLEVVKTEDTSVRKDLSAEVIKNMEFIMGKVLPYLAVKDLLSASRVNKEWNKVASENNLWKVVRMKNARVFDVAAFGNFLKNHSTEILDLRKMISATETDWPSLFKGLTEVTSLRQVVMNSTPDLITSLSEFCPDVEIISP